MDKLQIVDLREIEPKPRLQRLEELIEAIEDAPSYVTESGMWKYDRVPSGVVTDLLDFLWSIKDEVKKDDKQSEESV